MKINVDQVIKQQNGDPILDDDGTGNAIEATLKLAIVNALLANLESDKKDLPINKYQRGKLADRIYEGEGEIEFSLEEVTEIKERIGKVFNTLIMTRCWDMLDPQ